MKPVPSVLAALVTSLAAVAQSAPTLPELEFRVQLEPARVDFVMVSPEAPFIAVVLVAPTPDLAHFLVDLPPLLANSFVLFATPSTGHRFGVSFPDTVFPPGMELYVQGVAVSELGVRASQVDMFVLDATGQGD